MIRSGDCIGVIEEINKSAFQDSGIIIELPEPKVAGVADVASERLFHMVVI